MSDMTTTTVQGQVRSHRSDRALSAEEIDDTVGKGLGA